MQNFNFDLQRFSVGFEFTYGTKTFEDPEPYIINTNPEDAAEGFGNTVRPVYQSDNEYYNRKVNTDIYTETVTDATLAKVDEFSFDLQRFSGYRSYYNGSWYEYYDNYCVSESGGIYLLSSRHVYNFGDSDDRIIDNPWNVVTPWAYIQEATINCGGGNDRVYTSASSKNLILGGAGNDSICVHNCSDVTVSGGKGNDTIDVVHSGDNIILYENGDGNDVITGEGFDKLIISGGTYYTTRSSAGDPVIKVGSGSITFKGWSGFPSQSRISGVYKEPVPNSIISGTDGNDTLTNGDNEDVGEKIEGQRIKDAQDAEEIANEVENALREEWEPMIQDVLENGKDSEYLSGRSEAEKEAMIAFVADVRKNLLISSAKWTIAIKKAMLDAEADGYQRDLDWLEKRININSARKNQKFVKYFANGEVYYRYPDKEKYDRAIKKLNKRYEDKLDKQIKIKNVSKGLGILGAVLEGLEFVDAAVDAINNPGEGKGEKVVLEAVDVVTSTAGIFIPIPFVDNLASAVIKTGIVMMRHSDVDVGSTFMNNLIGITSDNYIPKYQLTSNSTDVVGLSAICDNDALQDVTPNDITTLTGAEGDDIMLNNKRDNVWMDGGADNDIIRNYNSSEVTVIGGTGDDLIVNLNAPNTTIDGGDDNDSIVSNYSANVSINTGNGNNAVSVYDGNGTTITAGNGNDRVENVGKYVSINTGAGNDSVLNIGAHVSINAGNGDNDIDSCGDEVTIQAGSGNNFIHAEGKNVFVTTGDGNNYIETHDNTNAVIQTGNSEDYILIHSDSGAINSGGGDDYLQNVGDSNLLEAGAGEDLIDVVGNSNLINGGNDNDLIWIYEGADNTVTGGKGDDSIVGEGERILFNYTNGDGNDVIESFNATSTLKIGTGSDTYSSMMSGNDVIIKVGNGSITLLDAANLTTLNIDGTQEEIVTYTLPAGLSVDDDTLKISTKFTGKKIDASEFSEVKAIDASSFKKPLQIVGNASDNTITGGSGNDTLTGGDGADTFVLGGGKDVVTDYTANKDKIFVESTPSVTVNNKSGDTVIQVGKNSLTLKKLNGENLSKGKTITFTDGTNETTQTYFSDRVVDGDSVTLQPAFKGTFDGSDFDKIDASNAKAGVKIIGGDSSSVLGSAKNDTLSGATLTGGKGSDIFIASGTATITDYETSDKISLGSAISDVKIDGKNVVLSFGDDTLTIEKGADKKVTLLNGKKSTPYIFGKHTIFDGSKKSVTLTAGNEFDASSYSALVTIDASQTDGIEIRDNAKANKITFGDGKNVFVWAKGNDTIYNFDTDDTLKISGVVTDASVTKKGATVLNVGKSKLTFDNTTEVKFTDSSGTKIFSAGIFCDAGETSATLPANFSQNTKTQLALDYATIDASNVKKALNISLGTGNDSIHGGKKGDSIHGGSGNDTLWGGGGNDSLWGDAGADKFIWQKGDGKDVIFGFDDNDMLEIIGLGGKVTGTFNKAGTELTVKVGNTAVAVLKNFTATTFNVNGNDYQISGSKLVKS